MISKRYANSFQLIFEVLFWPRLKQFWIILMIPRISKLFIHINLNRMMTIDLMISSFFRIKSSLDISNLISSYRSKWISIYRNTGSKLTTMRHFRFIVKHTFSISFNGLIVFFNNSWVDCWSSFVHVVCIDATCSVLNCRHFVTVEHVGIFSVTIFILCCQIVHVNFTQWMQRVWNWFWLHISSIRNKTNIRF